MPAEEKTDSDTKMSAEMFSHFVHQLGFPQEAASVLTFLKGIGQYQFQEKQHYFTIRDVYKYRQMMVEKGAKNKFESDFDFHEFFFKSIAHND